MNLGTYITRSSTFWPEREALVCGERRLSYADLERTTNRLASALTGRGLVRGETVATYAGNCAEVVETEMALCKAGLVRVPISPRLSVDEVAHILGDASVRVLFADTGRLDAARAALHRSGADCLLVHYGEQDGLAYAELLGEGHDGTVAVEVDEHDPAVLNFTSGSTGRLKAAVQTQGNRLANLRKRMMSPESAPSTGERYLAAGPITHAPGMPLLASLTYGSTVVVLPQWDTELFLSTVERERITATFVVPTMLNMLLAHPRTAATDLSSLKALHVGGAPVAPQRLKEAVETFGPIVVQGYGQVETTSGITVLTRQDVLTGATTDPELLKSCGRPVFDTEVRVVDETGAAVPAGTVGEVIARGPDCVTEYWHEPELTAETFKDGWVHTGDLGYLRADGYLFIVDRKKDMIISGGYNVYSSEVEAVLYTHPALAEVCVVGVPDEHWGEAVKAVVVRRPDSAVGEDEVIAFCAERLARVKKPRSVEFVDALPVNRNGKIDRRAVRARLRAAAERRAH
ncbi:MULTISPECIES: long-chain fatty acid--CoA ligase [unclassified Streptomyces]|uniref:acyl-CoA synthetase n=1 Tax=unclassified Streptomyces TaxID=2593676 RepID=UPI000DBAB1BE|nr:long-chain fatty acid--CoA ligase [Streptomyces sp. PsTaAH-137]MYT74746.1 AMP-binding protein [Streptomyces sp. SID8367]RAJ91733.1 acyl-CoA synthetase (AMP-forming)/AMP-acid ligase II [Streptomyces sp. PsTaAH-137]